MQSFSSDVDYFSFINESTTAPIMQMQHQSQERFESHLENLWNRDPYLNHVKQTEAEMLRSIERRNEERPPPLPLPLAMNENIKWTTIVSRCRKPSLNADENPSHRSSQFLNADDGFQEDYSDEEENNKENVANGSGGSSSQRTTESPGSSSAHRRKLVESQRSNNGNHLLDKRHIFYRIHYCTFWQAWIEGKGPKCRRGDTCFFAHGPDKLKKLDPMYYKTVLCEKFVSGDECPYGPSCNFAHGEKELRKTGFWGRQQVPNMQYHKHPNK